jgi:hypothetical protein
VASLLSIAGWQIASQSIGCILLPFAFGTSPALCSAGQLFWTKMIIVAVSSVLSASFRKRDVRMERSLFNPRPPISWSFASSQQDIFYFCCCVTCTDASIVGKEPAIFDRGNLCQIELCLYVF